jgi:hypothetical protein
VCARNRTSKQIKSSCQVSTPLALLLRRKFGCGKQLGGEKRGVRGRRPWGNGAIAGVNSGTAGIVGEVGEEVAGRVDEERGHSMGDGRRSPIPVAVDPPARPFAAITLHAQQCDTVSVHYAMAAARRALVHYAAQCAPSEAGRRWHGVQAFGNKLEYSCQESRASGGSRQGQTVAPLAAPAAASEA